jgi:hypothetical protein
VQIRECQMEAGLRAGAGTEVPMTPAAVSRLSDRCRADDPS